MGFIVRLLLFPLKLLRWVASWLLCSIILALLLATPAESITTRQRDAITQNCVTIKQTLGQLQKVDSRTRTYLGTTYETIANKFILPLNLRLVKNNRPTISEIQTNFIDEQLKFRSAYTDYMRELESLIAIDCRSHPDEFYGRLVIVREKRALLRSSTVKLAELSDLQYTKVVELKDSL